MKWQFAALSQCCLHWARLQAGTGGSRAVGERSQLVSLWAGDQTARTGVAAEVSGSRRAHRSIAAQLRAIALVCPYGPVALGLSQSRRLASGLHALSLDLLAPRCSLSDAVHPPSRTRVCVCASSPAAWWRRHARRCVRARWCPRAWAGRECQPVPSLWVGRRKEARRVGRRLSPVATHMGAT